MSQIKKFSMFLLELLLVITTIISGKHMVADVYKEKTLYKLDQWEKNDGNLNSNNWIETKNNMTQAISLSPNNPQFNIILGNVEQWKTNLMDTKQEKENQLRRVLKYYYKATRLSPTWPYAWSNIFIVKAKLGEIDDDFWFAIDNSIKNGRWEEDIHLDIVNVGLYLWNKINTNKRKIIINSIYAAAETSPQQLYAILKKYNQEKLICFNNKDKVIREMCGKNNL